MSKYIKEVLITFLILLSMDLNAQTTTTTSTGNWSNGTNWDNGVPNASTAAQITGTLLNPITTTVDADGVCDSLTITFGSLVINNGVELTINGRFSASNFGSVTNDGTLEFRGNFVTVLTGVILEVNGGVTTNSGLTFPSYTID